MLLNNLIFSLSGLVAFAIAAPTTQGDADIETVKRDTVTTLDRDDVWFAEGGCKTDWGGRCNAMCRGEREQKGYTCQSLDSYIRKSDCGVFSKKCECTCVH